MVALWIACNAAMAADFGPRMTGRTSTPECTDAMKLAEHMYASTANHLYAPLSFPANFESTMILGATEDDLSGGETLPASAAHFDLLAPSPANEIFWGKTVGDAGRLVVTTLSHGWRGDVYSLYVVPQVATPAQMTEEPPYEPLLDHRWRPPLVFVSKANPQPWFIEVDDQWSVHVADASAYAIACRIDFWPEPEDARAPNVLPEPVRRLAVLVDGTLGTGEDEGTLQQTARNRMHAREAWTKVAYRPWALAHDDALDQRATVDAGLKAWARGAPSFAQLHARILRTYPAAEAALAKYYVAHFDVDARQARDAARFNLDVAFRVAYAFPRETYGETPEPMQNPWPVTTSRD